MLRTMRGLPRSRPGTYAPGHEVNVFPQDIVAQLYPGADIPGAPHEALVRIENVTHKANGAVKRSDTVYPGSFVLIAAPEGTMAHGQILPIAVGMAVETSSKKGKLVVAWYLPEMADLFGAWAPVEGMSVETLMRCRLPNAIVNVQAVLECNFDLTEESALPYDLFDALRMRRSIDLSGFNTSMTRRGNMYRSYVLM